MTQPTIKVLQISQSELASFVSTELASTPLDGLNGVTLGSPIPKDQMLLYSGSPLEWRNVPFAQGLSGGDGINVTSGSPTSISVDSSVARRNAINTFQQTNTFTAAVGGISAGGVVLTSAQPGYILNETDAGVDGKIWRVFAASGQLFHDVRNDANDTSVNWLTVSRSGTTITSIDFIGTAMTFNGGAIHAGSPVGAGGGGASALGDLTDVTIAGGAGSPSTPLAEDILYYNGANWVNTAGALTWNGSILKTTGQMAFPNKVGSPGPPAIFFGSPDSTATGITGNSTSIDFVVAGAGKFQVTSSGNFDGMAVNNGPRMTSIAGTASTVAFAPSKADINTGMYLATTDALGLAAGGQPALQFHETSNEVIQTHHMDQGNTASTTQTQAGGLVMISSYNEIRTVANENDAVTLGTPHKNGLGRFMMVMNNGVNNTLQIFPSSGTKLSTLLNPRPAIDQPDFLPPGRTNFYIGTNNSGTPNWTRIIYPMNMGELTDVTLTGDGGSPVGTGSPATGKIGDTLFYDGTNWVNLARGTAGQVLTMGSPLLPSWQAAGGGSPASAQLILDIQTSVGGSPAVGSPLGAYTLVLGDEIDKWIRLTASSIIVPPNATTAFTIGSQVTIFNISGAATSIAAGGSPVGTVTINGVTSVDNDAGVAFIKVATDEWDAV